jgi:hypothetical protein
MTYSKFAIGVDYTYEVTPKDTVRVQWLCNITQPHHINSNTVEKPKTAWITERFNARKGNTLADARLSLPAGSHSTAETTALLACINREKLQTTSLVGAAIDGSWVGYANAMGLKYRDTHGVESRQIVTTGDLRQALRNLPKAEQPSALYFLTGYTRDVLYPQVLWGVTHQAAVEDYAMERMHAAFLTPRTSMKAGHKTCVAQLYGQIYNRKKMKLQRAVLNDNITVAVGRYGESANRNWKRPKHMFFVNTKTTTPGQTVTVDSSMVSHPGLPMFQNYLTNFYNTTPCWRTG